MNVQGIGLGEMSSRGRLGVWWVVARWFVLNELKGGWNEGWRGSGRVDYAVVNPVCETSRRSGTEVHFSHIISTLCGLSLVYRVVLAHVAGGGFWDSLIHDVFGSLFPNSAFSIDGVYRASYFMQPVLEIRGFQNGYGTM